MSTLVVVGYDDAYQADEVLLKLRKLQRDYLLDLEDAAVAIKDQQGKLKLHQTVNLTAAGALRGGSGDPHRPDFPESPAGLRNGCDGWRGFGLSDFGINDNFMKELAATMTPGSSTYSS